MRSLMRICALALLCGALAPCAVAAQNQTATLSPVLSEETLPFTLQISEAPFALPTGLQSFANAIYQGQWILIGGRTNGLHGFSDVGNNFPPSFQNRTVYVIDPATGQSWSRALTDGSAGLSQKQIDELSTTAAQSFQKGSTLYIVGGYGVDSATGLMGTKDTLTAIDLSKLVRWVRGGAPSVKSAIRQVADPFLQVTGGALYQDNDHEPFLLILGQNFVGDYRDGSNGIYTQQIRRFWVVDDGKRLDILPQRTMTTIPDYRRRDLNVVAAMRRNRPCYMALAGVFTLTTGVWTVPIIIKPDGGSTQPNPYAATTFKQAMNQYNCPAFGLYSTAKEEMFVVLPGGISYGYFSGGVFQTDPEIPFINQVTVVKIDKEDRYSQHLLDGEYPFIASTGSNPGNQLLFGAEAQFFAAPAVDVYHNGVLRLDELSKPTVIGYIAGGIMSTLPNTVTSSDSTSSPYVFTVTLVPRGLP